MTDGPIDRDALTDEITVALIEARRAGQAEGVKALKDLRARLELNEPPPAGPNYTAGWWQAIQATRAEAATVLANLTRSMHATNPTDQEEI